MKSLYPLLTLACILVFSLSCASIEDSDFFQPTNTAEYLLDAYQGNKDFELPNEFNIDFANINNIDFESFDGNSNATIHGIYLGDIDEIANRKIIVYCYDKTGNIDNYWPRIKLLGNLGLDEFGILAFDYRGYGKSTGSPSEESIYADTDAALRWLKDQGVSDEQVTIYGYGLGAAAAIELSVNPRSLTPNNIILEAPFASIESLLQNDLLLNVPASYLTDLSFDNADKIKNTTQPLLWLHGTNDEIYKLSQGQIVYDSHPGVSGETKFFHKVNGATHFNLPEKFANGFDGYLVVLLNFLQSN